MIRILRTLLGLAFVVAALAVFKRRISRGIIPGAGAAVDDDPELMPKRHL